MDHIPTIYRTKFRKNLTHEYYGYRDLEDLVTGQPDIAEVRTGSKGQLIVRATKQFRDQWAKEKAEIGENLYKLQKLSKNVAFVFFQNVLIRAGT